INPSLSPSPWITFQLDMVRAAVAVFPAAALWGASFPLALAAVVGPGDDAGRVVGRVYAANTVGAILGAAFFSVIVVPHWGTRHGQQLLIAIALTSALVVFVAARRAHEGDAQDRDALRASGTRLWATLLAAAGAAAAIACVVTVPAIPDGLVA